MVTVVVPTGLDPLTSKYSVLHSAQEPARWASVIAGLGRVSVPVPGCPQGSPSCSRIPISAVVVVD